METLTNQEFLYRENPVDYDGTGTITRIKGNTVKFNQLIQNGNFTDSTTWVANRGSLSVSNNKATVSLDNATNFISIFKASGSRVQMLNGHKYLFKAKVSSNSGSFQFVPTGSTNDGALYFTVSGTQTVSGILAWNRNVQALCELRFPLGSLSGQTLTGTVENFMLTDLTAMGIDNLTTVEQVEEWLSNKLGLLPYYDYTKGSLISFNGTNIETVSKNQFDVSQAIVHNSEVSLVRNAESGTIRCIYNDSGIRYTGFYIYQNPLFTNDVYRKKYKYRLSFDVSGIDTTWTVGLRRVYTFVGGQTRVFSQDGHYSMTLDVPNQPDCYISFSRTGDLTSAFDVTFSNIQLEIGETETAFVPYQENTISLPISNLFPTGMKEARSVHDELTESKAITRIVKRTINNTTAFTTNYGRTNGDIVRGFAFGDAKIPPNNNTVANIVSTIDSMSANGLYNSSQSGVAINTAGRLDICIAGITTAEALNTYLSNNPITVFYELATPTEQDISLDLTYPVYQDGTEQILPVNGSTPVTLPIIADIDYRGLIPVNAEDDPDGSGIITGTGNYRYHSPATLIATPTDEIYRFLRWEDENGDTVSTNSTYTFLVGD